LCLTTVKLPSRRTTTAEGHFDISAQTFNAIVDGIAGVATAFGIGVNALIGDFAVGAEAIAVVLVDFSGTRWQALTLTA
jgi:hypothetical protein